ncbi:MAG: T9SS type A sorting domain-containing protein [Bacteroidota bacterium]
MKTNYLLFVLLSLSTISFGQTFLWESFDAGQMPPAGWSINGLPAQWSVSNTANAGGVAPEAKFTYVQQNTTTRLISPTMDLTGMTSVKLSFKYFYDWYSNPAPKIGVATRSHNGAWNTVWEKIPTGNVGPIQIDVQITNGDIGQSEFQICFFLTGNMYNLDYVYIDNVLLFNPLNKDAGLVSLSSTPNFFADPVQVKGNIMNFGTTTITDAEIQYTIDHGPVNTTTITGLSLTTQQTYTFTCNQLADGILGSHDLTVWINKINGSPDDNLYNDTLQKTITKVCHSTSRKPLFEEFTSSTCAPCAQFNAGFVPWCTSHEDDITLVKYQMNWPAPGDPYYTAEGGVRKTFYGVGFVPDLYVNGEETATEMAAVQQAFNQANLRPGLMKITCDHSLNGTVMTINASVLPFYNCANATVYIVVMEKITHNNHSTNGETSFHHVMMKMVPDANGITTNLIDRVPFSVNEIVDLAGTHIEEYTDLIVAVFVQDGSTKDVYQSAYSDENAVFGTEAHLSDISVDGIPLPDFNPDTYTYDLVLPGGTAVVPQVQGIPVDANATVILVPAVTLPGVTTIDVFAENLVAHNLYTLNFSFAVGQDELKNEAIRIYPNPAKDLIYLFGALHAQVIIYNSLGVRVNFFPDFNSNVLDLTSLSEGVYLISIEKSDKTLIQKKIVVL